MKKTLFTLALLCFASLSSAFAIVMPDFKAKQETSVATEPTVTMIYDLDLAECCYTATASASDGNGGYASATVTFCAVTGCVAAYQISTFAAQIEARQQLERLNEK